MLQWWKRLGRSSLSGIHPRHWARSIGFCASPAWRNTSCRTTLRPWMRCHIPISERSIRGSCVNSRPMSSWRSGTGNEALLPATNEESAVDDYVATIRNRPLSLYDMRRDIAAISHSSIQKIGLDDDLIAMGLDSIDVMKLASIWASRGYRIAFGELLQRRTLREWCDMVGSMQPATAVSQQRRADDSEPFELSTMQHAYWFGRRHATAMNAPSHYYFEFDGSNVDSARLASAVESLFARHPLLRARFLDDGRQQILPVDTSRGLKIRGLRELGAQQAAAILRQVRDEESNRCLD